MALDRLTNMVLLWYNQHTYDHFLTLNILIFIVCLIGTKPIVVNPRSEPSLVELLIIKFRQLVLAFCALVFIALPLIIFVAGTYKTGSAKIFFPVLWGMWETNLILMWELPLIAFIGGYGISFVFARHIKTIASAFKRKFSLRQTGDELSDIRVEGKKIKEMNFQPQKYYKENAIFYGLDEKGKPIYDSIGKWQSRHQRWVGPTQTGKGVGLGVQLDQAIRKGYNTWFFDQKPDKHAFAIMKKACEETGRKLITLDLNPEGKGKYNPFLGGSRRDRLSRLYYAFGLKDTGEQSDFYKVTERDIITAFKDWDGSLRNLKERLSEPEVVELVKRTRSYITEWLSISTFDVKNRAGFSVDRSIIENPVVYIRGNLDDELITMAMTVLLVELMQTIKRLDQAGEKIAHSTVVVDELAFLVNEKIADSLATIAGFGTNMILTYQSEGDLLNPKDKTLDGKAISTRIKVNTKTAVYYMAADYETAEMMAKESGTINKKTTFSQDVKVGRYAEETWEDGRSIKTEAENLVTENAAKMLPERVGYLYRPNELTVRCHTCWISVDLKKYSDESVNKTNNSTGGENLEKVAEPQLNEPEVGEAAEDNEEFEKEFVIGESL